MNLKDRIAWLVDLAHSHVDENRLSWTKTGIHTTAHLTLPYRPDINAGWDIYKGMFAIRDASDYETPTFQLSISDTWDTDSTYAGYAKANDAILACAKNATLAIPAQFINDEAYKEIGYVVAKFSLDGSNNPQFDGFAIWDEATFATYTIEKAHYLIGRVYGIEVTDGSLVTTTIYFNQEHRGWISDVILKECP